MLVVYPTIPGELSNAIPESADILVEAPAVDCTNPSQYSPGLIDTANGIWIGLTPLWKSEAADTVNDELKDPVLVDVDENEVVPDVLVDPLVVPAAESIFEMNERLNCVLTLIVALETLVEAEKEASCAAAADQLPEANEIMLDEAAAVPVDCLENSTAVILFDQTPVPEEFLELETVPVMV